MISAPSEELADLKDIPFIEDTLDHLQELCISGPVTIMSDTDTKYCSNCKRNIASGNFLMHNAHCERNIKLCLRCNEPVPRTEMDNHMDTFHKIISCDKCNEEMEQCKIEDHQVALCSKRPVQCDFCELDIPLDAMEEHESFCGSRTEACTKCGSYVMFKDKNFHSKTDCKKVTEAKYLEKSELERKREMLKEKQNSESVLSKNNSSSQFKSKSAKDLYHDRRDLPPADNFLPFQPTPDSEFLYEQLGFLLSPDLFPSNIGKLQENMTRVNPSASYTHYIGKYGSNNHVKSSFVNNSILSNKVVTKSSTSSSHIEDDSVSLPCEFCNDLFPEDVLIQHQSGCRPDLLQHFSHSTKPDNFKLSSVEQKPCVGKSENSTKNCDKANMITDDLPCEFCNKLCSSERELTEHQNFCKDNMIQPKEKLPRETFSSSSQMQDKNITASEFEPFDGIPCEFCNRLYHENDLIQHQISCSENFQEAIAADEKYPNSKSKVIDKKFPFLSHSVSPPFMNKPRNQSDASLPPLEKPFPKPQRKKTSKDGMFHTNNSLIDNKYSKAPMKLYGSDQKMRKNVSSKAAPSCYSTHQNGLHSLGKNPLLKKDLKKSTSEENNLKKKAFKKSSPESPVCDLGDHFEQFSQPKRNSVRTKEHPEEFPISGARPKIYPPSNLRHSTSDYTMNSTSGNSCPKSHFSSSRKNPKINHISHEEEDKNVKSTKRKN